MKNPLKTTAVALALALTAITAALAQDQDRNIGIIKTPEGIIIEETVPAEEISRERPRRMHLVEPEPAPTPASEQLAEAAIVPIHFSEPIRREAPPPQIDTAAAKKETKKEAKNESEYENRFALGTDLAFGSAAFLSFSGNMRIPAGASRRIDVGLGFGAFGGGCILRNVETSGFYGWRFDVDDGVLGWYVGTGAALGWYWAERDVEATTTEGESVTLTQKSDGFGMGIGGVIGLEVALSFIDTDHSLYSLKDMMLGMNVRPMLYLTGAKGYPRFVITFGVAVRWAL